MTIALTKWAEAGEMRDYRKLKKTELIDMVRNYEFAVRFIRERGVAKDLSEGLLGYVLDDIDKRNEVVLNGKIE